MARDGNIKFTKDNLKNLQHLSDLLHLFHHRNKNQHRRSIWWRHFSIFRRQVNALVVEVSSVQAEPTTHLERTQKKAKDADTEARISQRLTFWQEMLIEKWQGAFSQLVADNRFAVLGLVLTAALAEVCDISGVTAKMKFAELSHDEAEDVLRSFERQEPAVGRFVEGMMIDHNEEDLGEVVHREEATTSAEPTQSVTPKSAKVPRRSTSTTRVQSPEAKPARMKRKKDNAIDDLFSGLG